MRILLFLIVLIQAFPLQAMNPDLIKSCGLVSGNGTKTASINSNLCIAPQLGQLDEYKLAIQSDAWLLSPVMAPPPPNWVPVSNLQFNMNVIGKIQISPGVYSVNENDIIGAFVGSECRGVASPYASLGGILFLTIGSNIQSGETVTFKIYFASTNEIINANETIPFQNAGDIGTMASPFIFTFTAPSCGLAVTPSNQNVAYTPAGSTSFSVTSNCNWTALSNQTWCTVTPSGSGNGTITANYAINTTTSTRTANITVTVSGVIPIVVTVTQEPTPCTLSVTPPNQNVTYSPAGSTSFSVTSNCNWTALSNQAWCTVTPSGSGNGTITANYAINTTTSTRTANITVTVSGVTPIVVTVTQAPTPAAPTWIPVPNLQFNMNVIGKIQISPGVYSLSENDIVAAFVGTECRGVASPYSFLDGMLFLTIGSNILSGETVTFKIYLSSSNEIVNANETILFQNAGEVGTMASPFIFTYSAAGNTLNLNLFLEGLTSNNSMNKTQGASGNQFPGTVADVITVELHAATAPFSKVGSAYSVNLITDGTATTTIPSAYNGSYYVVIKSRNHIETWSSNPISFTTSPININLSASQNSAYSNNLKLVGGKFCIYVGDVNQDGTVGDLDLTLLSNKSAIFNTGYIIEDLNGDGIVDAIDMIMLDNNAANFVAIKKP